MKKGTVRRILTLAVALTTVFTAGNVMPSNVHAATKMVPVYRLYNPSNGEHLYTTDAHEKDVIYKTQGWGYEGIGWYAADGTGEPVYRLYNDNQKNHLYTTDTNEVNVLTSQYGWVADFDGKPLFYSSGDVPVYRVYNEAQSGMHHLTTDRHEYDTLPQYGWVQEGDKISAVKIGEPITTEYYPLIEATDADSAIQADITLTGSGTGYHAKLVLCTATAAVSYGIQYDAHAVAPYTGKTMLMVENIGSNAAGGQTYDRPGNIELVCGQTYRLMITYNKNGTGSLYMNNQLVGTWSNPALANVDITPRVEGAGRLDGDSVDAEFRNIKIKKGGTYDKGGWNTHEFQVCPTIKSTTNGNWDSVSVKGTVSGLGAGNDWDNKYDQVSGIMQFFR